MNQSHKFALSGGGYCLYSPVYPRHQYELGFADEVRIFNIPIEPLFALTVLEDGVPLTLECNEIDVQSGKAMHFENEAGLEIVETRYVTADDRFVSELKVVNEGKDERKITAAMWTWTDPEGEAPSLEGDSVRIRRTLQHEKFAPVPVEIVWGNPDSKGARCLLPFFAEGGSNRPDWEETPWYGMAELPTPRAKKPMVKPSPILPNARVYIGVFREIELKGGASVEHRFEANIIFKGKGINYRPRRPDPKDENTYQAFMDKAPKFECEDPRLERIVKHRLELIHLLRVPHGVGHISSPSVCEGSGDRHQPVSFSAPAIMREVRWLADPTLGRGILKGFFDNVRQNGMVPGRLYMTSLQNCDFFHADWGGGFMAFDQMHGDKATKRAVLMSMQRYVKWLANTRDPEGSGLTDITNQFESGQEFSRRYTIIDDKADRAEENDEQFRLKGIDASVFRYKLVHYLAQVADEAQEKAMANRFIAEREVIQDIIRRRMWDEKAKLFMDVDPKTRRRTGVKAAVGFYPLGTDIPTPEITEALLSTLGDRKEFWTPYPVPSLALSDPFYDVNGHWKGTRRNGPWNGRVWPMVNSHIMEGLSYVAERGNKKAQKLLGDLFERTIKMVSGELENSEEPTCFEHYSPETGMPGRYRGVDVYLHSFLMDNIFRVACGFAVRFGEIQDDPVIDDMPDFKLRNIPVGNKLFDIERKNGKLKIQGR